MLEYGVTFSDKGERTTAAAIVRLQRESARTEKRYDAADPYRLVSIKRKRAGIRPADLSLSVDVSCLCARTGRRDLNISGGEQVLQIGYVQHRIRRRWRADAARAVHVLSQIGGNH